jgi:hypothetical protein
MVYEEKKMNAFVGEDDAEAGGIEELLDDEVDDAEDDNIADEDDEESDEEDTSL